MNGSSIYLHRWLIIAVNSSNDGITVGITGKGRRAREPSRGNAVNAINVAIPIAQNLDGFFQSQIRQHYSINKPVLINAQKPVSYSALSLALKAVSKSSRAALGRVRPGRCIANNSFNSSSCRAKYLLTVNIRQAVSAHI